MPDRPRLYVHCGLHKTGSTSLQAALRASESGLRAAGFLYPYAGSLTAPGRTDDPNDSGHHNIGWQLTRNRLFDRRHGDLVALEAELRGAAGDAILSSEFVECALHRPDALAPLRTLADTVGRDLVLIVYLRNQIDYWDSLFHEMIKHGDGRAYADLAEEILATGHYRFRESVNQFDYERVLTTMLAWGGAEIVLRNYHSLVGNSIITDFAALLGLGDALRPRAGHAAANQRLNTADSLDLFHRNRAGRRPTPIESARLRHIASKIGRSMMGAELRQRFVDRFAEGNRRLCARFGLPQTGLDLGSHPATIPVPSLDALFSFDTQSLIVDGTARVLPDWASGIETAADAIPPGAILLHRGRRAGKAIINATKTLIRRRRAPR